MGDESGRQDRIKELSAGILVVLQRIAAEARAQLGKRSAISTDKLAQGNTLNSPETVNSFSRIARDVLENAERLAIEPAIARVVAVDEQDAKSIYFISRGASSMRSEGDQHYCSHYAPAGELASLSPGDTLDLSRGGEVVTLEVVERTVLHPKETSAGWDSFDSEFEIVEADDVCTVTIQSLLRLIGEALDSEDPLAAIEKMIADAEEGDNLIEGRVRRILRKAELRDQAVLDRYQSKTFRLPIDRQLVILGSPGTGKTTTLIRRLGQKINYIQFPDEEKATIDRAASALPHANSWLMFTPTDLLRSYLKEAFSREDVPASDNVIRTWTAHRHDLARNTFGLLRVGGSGGRFVARDDAPTLRDEAADQIAWFEDFQNWQTDAFWTDLTTAAELLASAASEDAASLGGRLGAALRHASASDAPSVIVALVGFVPEVRALVDALNAEINDAYKRALSAQLRADPNFFASLMTFIDGVADAAEPTDEADDEDDDEEDEPARRHLRAYRHLHALPGVLQHHDLTGIG